MVSFLNGLLVYLRSAILLIQPRYAKYILYAGLLSLSIFGFIAFALFMLSKSLVVYWPDISIWGLTINGELGSWALGGLSFVIILFLYKYVVLIINAPLMSRLSYQIELVHIRGEIFESTNGVCAEIGRSIKINGRSMLRELLYTLPLGLLSFVPGIGVVAIALVFLVQSYYAGVGNYDYWAERHLNYRDTLVFTQRHRLEVLANGIVYLVILLVPFIGVFLAPPLGSIAATLQASKRYESTRSY